MSSVKQIDANRRNALKSTGPTTVEGKLRSRSNAVRHGLTAETVIATMEDIDDYEAFEATVIADYDAETAVERELVLRMASVLWRLRRSTLIETGLFESSRRECSRTRSGTLANDSWRAGRTFKSQRNVSADVVGNRCGGENWSRIQFKKGYRPLLLVSRGSTEKCSRSSEPLRTDAMAASPTTCSHARHAAAPQATAASFNLSIFTPIAEPHSQIGADQNLDEIVVYFRCFVRKRRRR